MSVSVLGYFILVSVYRQNLINSSTVPKNLYFILLTGVNTAVDLKIWDLCTQPRCASSYSDLCFCSGTRDLQINQERRLRQKNDQNLGTGVFVFLTHVLKHSMVVLIVILYLWGLLHTKTVHKRFWFQYLHNWKSQVAFFWWYRTYTKTI